MTHKDEIDWTRVSTAHGTAAHVPQAVIGLASPDPGKQEESYWSLDNFIVLQSDLYEAAYYAIALILRLLETRGDFSKRHVYDLLYEIAAGSAPPEQTVLTRSGERLPLKTACRRELEAARALFLRDAQLDADPGVRTTALELLEVLADRQVGG